MVRRRFFAGDLVLAAGFAAATALGANLQPGADCVNTTVAYARRPLTVEERTAIDKAYDAKYWKAKKELDELNLDAKIAFGNFPHQIGERFDAHGMAKKTPKQQLDDLLALLEKGIDPKAPLSISPLVSTPGTGAMHGALGGAYKDGSFVVVGPMDGKLFDPATGKTRIEYVIVNDAYYDAIGTLSAAYPDVTFLKATDAPAFLRDLAAKAPKK